MRAGLNPQELIAEVLEQIQGIWRYRWAAVSVTWAVCLLGWLGVYTIPDVYHASARVYVDANTLIKPLMQGLTAQHNTMNDVQLVSEAVLTRPNLEAVARTTDLGVRAHSTEGFENLITGLQRSVRVTGGRDNIFTIEYEDVDRDKARDVVAAVLDTFINSALGAQGDDAQVTERALAGEIQDHEQRLQTADTALANFKKANLGYMPGESGDYYTRLQTALARVDGTEEKIRQLDQRRTELKRQIEGEEPVFGLTSQFGGATTSNCSQSAQIAAAKSQLAELLINFTDMHPRVLALKDTIASLEQRCDKERTSQRGSEPVFVANGADPLQLNPVYENLRVQLSNTEVELVEARSVLGLAEASVRGLKRDVDKIAEVEAQLKQLNRDYAVVQQRHQELLRRWEDLQAKKRLDPVTENVQFRRIEPPFARAEPVGPNRPLFLVGVLAVAVGVGILVGFGLNILRPVCCSRRSLNHVSGLPVLGEVTMVSTPTTHLRRKVATYSWVSSYVTLFIFAALVIRLSDHAGELMRLLRSGAPL